MDGFTFWASTAPSSMAPSQDAGALSLDFGGFFKDADELDFDLPTFIDESVDDFDFNAASAFATDHASEIDSSSLTDFKSDPNPDLVTKIARDLDREEYVRKLRPLHAQGIYDLTEIDDDESGEFSPEQERLRESKQRRKRKERSRKRKHWPADAIESRPCEKCEAGGRGCENDELNWHPDHDCQAENNSTIDGPMLQPYHQPSLGHGDQLGQRTSQAATKSKGCANCHKSGRRCSLRAKEGIRLTQTNTQSCIACEMEGV
ncbi:hypothetical protein ANO11243_026180 [Dothideomycetidae sp. 11243]|nr:hypothetical protein ANO11243_026180 [fungal sp. No.11243]